MVSRTYLHNLSLRYFLSMNTYLLFFSFLAVACSSTSKNEIDFPKNTTEDIPKVSINFGACESLSLHPKTNINREATSIPFVSPDSQVQICVKSDSDSNERCRKNITWDGSDVNTIDGGCFSVSQQSVSEHIIGVESTYESSCIISYRRYALKFVEEPLDAALRNVHAAAPILYNTDVRIKPGTYAPRVNYHRCDGNIVILKAGQPVTDPIKVDRCSGLLSLDVQTELRRASFTWQLEKVEIDKVELYKNGKIYPPWSSDESLHPLQNTIYNVSAKDECGYNLGIGYGNGLEKVSSDSIKILSGVDKAVLKVRGEDFEWTVRGGARPTTPPHGKKPTLPPAVDYCSEVQIGTMKNKAKKKLRVSPDKGCSLVLSENDPAYCAKVAINPESACGFKRYHEYFGRCTNITRDRYTDKKEIEKPSTACDVTIQIVESRP